MAATPRTYRQKPIAVFEHGTRIYAPSRGESRWRVVAASWMLFDLDLDAAVTVAARILGHANPAFTLSR